MIREIERLAALGHNPPAITKLLEDHETLRPIAPSERTVRKYYDEWRRRDTSGDWTWDDDAPAVLPVISLLMGASGGQVSRVTRKEAEWIGRLARVDPDMSPGVLIEVARILVKSDAAGVEWGAAHELVALRPWTEGGDRRLHAILRGVAKECDVLTEVLNRRGKDQTLDMLDQGDVLFAAGRYPALNLTEAYVTLLAAFGAPSKSAAEGSARAEEASDDK